MKQKGPIMTELKNPEDYEILAISIAFIDAASNALDGGVVKDIEEIMGDLRDIRNELNQRRLDCLGGEFDLARFAERKLTEGADHD